MDEMREIVAVGVVSKVRNQLVEITGVGLERAARREVDVSNNFVYANSSKDVAAFICLLLQLLCPSFVLALLENSNRSIKNKANHDSYFETTDLLNSVRIGKTPASINVRLADFLAGITASALGFQPTVARATIAVFLGVIHFVEVVSEFRTEEFGYCDAIRIKSDF